MIRRPCRDLSKKPKVEKSKEVFLDVDLEYSWDL